MFYVVRALSPYTEYEFMVIAVNNIGRGPQSAPATCTTGETGNEILISLKRFFFHLFLLPKLELNIQLIWSCAKCLMIVFLMSEKI